MNVPTVKVTMLGDSGSGKTTFMVGMLGSMLPGEPGSGYAVYSAQRNDGLDLIDSWRRLRRAGTFPDPTFAGGYKEYRFSVNRSLGDPILSVDWLDYRGGAIADGDEHDDAADLVARLEVSDSIYLALDGEEIGKWVADLVTNRVTARGSYQAVQDQLGIQHLAQLVGPAVNKRKDVTGGHQQSIVVLLTKSDRLLAVLEPLSMEWDDAFKLAQDAVRQLFDLAFGPNVKTLINPSSVAMTRTDGEAAHDIETSGFKPPFLFTFLCYLEEAVANEDRRLAELRKRKEDVDAWLAKLESRMFKLGKRKLEQEKQQLADAIVESKSRIQDWRNQTERLRRELRGAAVYDGTQPRSSRPS